MVSPWETFVQRAIAGDPDDSFVAMLRRRLATGARVVRVQLDADARPPAYRVLTERLRELSELRIPHSPAFTRWSLGAAVRMATADDEARRFALIAAERFQALADDLGQAEARQFLIERLRVLAPTETMAVLAGFPARPPAAGRAHTRAAARVDRLLQGLATDLGRALRYSPPEVSSILDRALAYFVRDLLDQQSDRPSLRKTAG
ncbi:MAG TPA: hypothetical protein VLS89_21290 [Candidatus Nanopelagicales bacterium]|nr:hypothetical protein [Candidatus Nanopelagicales bacterium]